MVGGSIGPVSPAVLGLAVCREARANPGPVLGGRALGHGQALEG